MKKDKLSTHLQAELQKIDQIAEPDIPGHEELLKRLVQFRTERRKAMVKEGMLFLVFALIVVSVAVMALIQAPAIFIALQVLVLLCLPGLIAAEKRRQPADIEVKER
ncbi:YxlC family protein [Bacillus sp. YC2]|uniref:YxlC family protein n=1 Tax=Bacillus sp. YC2 TaxID=2861287 RepID=UPI001CA76C62|nr:YxlC family protein [Bacillus sp. YC2]MBY8911892.1 YxlC family protein [Bacillus sp. YC2]